MSTVEPSDHLVRRRVRTRVVGALMVTETDDAPVERLSAPRTRIQRSPSTVAIDAMVTDSTGGSPMRIVVPRSWLEEVARLRDLRDTAKAATPSDGVISIPRLLRIGAVSIVRLVDLARAAGITIAATPSPAAAAARKLLHQRLDAVVRVEDIAGELGMHRVHLSREFHRWFGVPVMRYVYDLRVERAIEELATTTHSLARIAVANGFADHGHLTRRFRDRLGIVPSALRHRMRSPRNRLD